MQDEDDAPPTVPELPTYRQKRDERRRTRNRIDHMLRIYWADLIAQSEPLAEEILERALRDAALSGTLLV
jgi:hypothetical protein